MFSHIAPWWLHQAADPISWAVATAAAIIGGTCAWILWTLWIGKPATATHRRPDGRHVGVTLDSPPLADLMPAEGLLRTAEPVASMAEVEVAVDHQLDEWHEIEAAAVEDGWPVVYSAGFEAAMAAMEARVDRAEASLRATGQPLPTYHEAAFAAEPGDALGALLDHTGQWSTHEFRVFMAREDVADAARTVRETPAQRRRREHHEHRGAGRVTVG